MKKLTILIMMLCLMISTTHAYTLTKIVNGKKLVSNVSEGQTVTVRYIENAGYVFKKWTIQPKLDYLDEESKTLRIVMPDENVTLTMQNQALEYTISYQLDGGTENTNPTSYTVEDKIELNAPIKNGYKFLGWTGSNGNLPQKNVIISNGSTGNKLYIANWEKVDTYQLTTKINGITETSQKQPGESITLTVTPATGYRFSKWETIGVLLEQKNPITFNMPEKDITVEAIIEEIVEVNKYELRVNPNGGVWNGASGIQTIAKEAGEKYEVANPTVNNAIYTVSFNGNGGTAGKTTLTSTKSFSSWTKTGGGTLSGTIYTFGDSDAELVANYVSSSISLPDATRDGYNFSGWYTETTGGTWVGGAGDSYKPTSSGELHAQWTKSEFTITVTQKENGIISPAGPIKVASGGAQTFAIAPYSGYKVSSVLVDGVNVGAVESYTLNNIAADHTIIAYYEPAKYTITVTQTTGGTISPSTQTGISYGGNCSFTITPNSGYKIKNVKVNGVDQGSITNYTFNNIRSNQTITATYDAAPQLATLSVGTYITYIPSSISYKVYETDSGYGIDDANDAEYQEFNPSATTLWRVMYNNSGQLDIVSADAVHTANGGGLYINGATGYAKVVDTLNNLGKAYVNSTYATTGRHLGSTSSSVGTITTPTTWEYTYVQGNTGFPYVDDLYDRDTKQLKNNGLLPASSSYNVWTTTRFISFDTESERALIGIRYITSSGYTGFAHNVGMLKKGGSSVSYGRAWNELVRPIVSLKTALRVVAGSGTETAPYILGVN